MSHCCHIAVTLLLKWQLRSKGASFVCCFHSSAHISGGKNFPCVFLIEEEEAQKETEGVQSQKMKKGCLGASCFFLFYQKNAAGAWGVQGCPMVSGTILTEDSLGPVGCQVEPPWKGFAPVYPTGAWSDWAMESMKTGSLPRTHFVSFNCWVVVQFPAEEMGGAACHRGHGYWAESACSACQSNSHMKQDFPTITTW